MLEENKGNIRWISSRELIKISAISRATLNNYISIGILPKPVVRRPDEVSRVVKIGYFPESAIAAIEKIKRLKKEGASMNNIVKMFRNQAETQDDIRLAEVNYPPASHGESIDHVTAENHLEGNSGEWNRGVIKQPLVPEGKNGLNLSLDSLNIPAYLVNYKFEIEWINTTAEEQIFHKQVRTIRDAESRNIFRLCLNWELSNQVENWGAIVDFHMSFLKARQPIDSIDHMYSDMSASEAEFLRKVYERIDTSSMQIANQAVLTLRQREKEESSYRVYTTFFREGILFLYVPTDLMLNGINELLSSRETVIRNLLGQRLPTLVPFCVLVADLQDSVRICAELPPEEYFELINNIWKTMEESFKKYYGIYGKHVGDGIVYYFLKERDSNYIMNAIECAMEIKKKMDQVSSQWKIRKKWYNELHLNTGINEGHEYFSAIHASTSIEFTALGDTINYAARLSDIARSGSILTTKNLVNKLSEEDKKKFHFGIRRNIDGKEVFVENVFSRVLDLMAKDDPRQAKFIDIAALPITEILE